MVILDLWGMAFHAVVSIALVFTLLFKSASGYCDYLADYLLADYWLIIGLLLANFEIVIKSFPENRKNNQTQKGDLLEIKNPAKVYD